MIQTTTIIQWRCGKQPKQPDVCDGNWEESETGDRGAQAACHKCNRLVIIWMQICAEFNEDSLRVYGKESWLGRANFLSLCLILIITTSSSKTEEEFNIFYNNMTTKLS